MKEENTAVTKKKHAGPHPKTFKPEFTNIAETACTQYGCTDPDLSTLFHVKPTTLESWKRDYDGFAEAIRRGRDAFNSGRVEKTLMQRALGYRYKEVTVKQTTLLSGPKGKQIKLPAVERTIVKKHMAPDVTAILFFLQNRNPARWRNVKYLIADGEVRTVDRKEFILDVKNLTDEELQVVRGLMQRKKDKNDAIEAEVTKVTNEQRCLPVGA